MKLYFKNSDVQNHYDDDKLDITKLKYIDEFETLSDVYKFIKEFWELRGISVYYYRICDKGDYCKIDYGSHTQFYYVVGDDLDLKDSDDNKEKLSDEELNELNSKWMLEQIKESQKQFATISDLDITEVRIVGYDGNAHRVEIDLNSESLNRFKNFVKEEIDNEIKERK